MRVLQIEDDAATSRVVEFMLKAEGFAVYSTDLGEEGIDLAKQYDYDIVLLDLNLPDMSGFDVLRQLRAAKIDVPVLVLTGTEAVEAEVRCFALGADDFLRKPFHRDVLIQRVRAVVRRFRGQATSMIQCGPIVIDLDLHAIRVSGEPIHFTGKEYRMLELLALRQGLTITKEMFLNHLYGGLDEPEMKIVDVFICKIRRKLGEDAGLHLETVWGRGYRLVSTVTPKAEPPPDKDRYAPDSMKGRVLARLAQGDASLDNLKSLSPYWNTAVLRNAVAHLLRAGLIVNASEGPRAVYSLTKPQLAAA